MQQTGCCKRIKSYQFMNPQHLFGLYRNRLFLDLIVRSAILQTNFSQSISIVIKPEKLVFCPVLIVAKHEKMIFCFMLIVVKHEKLVFCSMLIVAKPEKLVFCTVLIVAKHKKLIFCPMYKVQCTKT